MRTLREHTSPAQALVEFALAATLIFFLLAAVVDLGLIYFTMQALRVSAQEGATYGSYPRVETDAQSRSNVVIDYSEIVYRVYGSAGERGGGFADLRDLNSDGIDDLGQGLHNNMATDPDAYIYIENLAGIDPQNLSDVGCRGDLPGEQLQAGGRGCWLRVTVRYDYEVLFPFAPAIGDTIQLRAAHLTPMRSTVFTTAQ
ncbi:MAG: pilus assembly protein [Candidatus Viridilinea halotolerans]|uniref:Pilus assembly protein n=1 Tax=Candidatus Viridilinea halotolerans TaxID=2491704 RepID=A0A426TR17_9CHLR|nr:MAG: pilus assembly protein [Candidatus Viridilinea halotolerans]